jgi:hypothetical protein
VGRAHHNIMLMRGHGPPYQADILLIISLMNDTFLPMNNMRAETPLMSIVDSAGRHWGFRS